MPPDCVNATSVNLFKNWIGKYTPKAGYVWEYVLQTVDRTWASLSVCHLWSRICLHVCVCVYYTRNHARTHTRMRAYIHFVVHNARCKTINIYDGCVLVRKLLLSGLISQDYTIRYDMIRYVMIRYLMWRDVTCVMWRII